MTDIEAIRARLKAATPGPWEWHVKENWYANDENFDAVVSPNGANVLEAYSCDGCGHIDVEAPDAQFIAHAPQDIADLLAELEQVKRDAWEQAERAAKYGNKWGIRPAGDTGASHP
jgi:hypothetical protein